MCKSNVNLSRIGKATPDYNRRIFEYTDVSSFKFAPHINRAVNEKNVNAFVKLMKSGKFDPERGVIIVDVNTKITVDGQHRVQAYKKAQEMFGYDVPLLVRYVDAPQKVEELQLYIAELQKGRKWTLEDYISANIASKNDLRRVEEFCFSHPLLHKGDYAYWSKAACIISHLTTQKDYKAKLRDRHMRFTEEEWNNAETVYGEAERILAAMNQDNPTSGFEYIVNAWKKIRYDIDTMGKVCRLKDGFNTFIELIRANRVNVPGGSQAVEPYYDFFLGLLN